MDIRPASSGYDFCSRCKKKDMTYRTVIADVEGGGGWASFMHMYIMLHML